MTIVPTATLLATLSYMKFLDTTATPFVALHLATPGAIPMRRTTPTGYVETDDAPHPDDPGWSYASLEHLAACLRFIHSDATEVLRLYPSGNLMLRSVNTPFESELRVHTVAVGASGIRTHSPGSPFKEVDLEWLLASYSDKGIQLTLDVRPFLPLAFQPIIQGTKLLMVAQGGTVLWETGMDPRVPSSPTATILLAAAEMNNGCLTLTTGGYYAACFNGITFCLGSHQTGFPGLPPSTVGAHRIATLNAERVITSLRMMAQASAPGAPITFTPRGGFITHNQFGQSVRFSVGETSAFVPFDLQEKSAKLIADALCQVTDPEITVYRIPSASDRVLFERGKCLVAIQASPTPV